MSKASATTTITRLRTGDSLAVSFKLTGATVIFYNDSGVINSFSPTNFLQISPVVASLKGFAVTKKSGVWKLNGNDVTASSFAHKSCFEVTSSGDLKVIGTSFFNASNPQNFVITWEGTVTVNGYDQVVTKSVELTAVNGGSNSYWGTIEVLDGSTILAPEAESVTLTQHLLLGGESKKYGSDYKVKWEINEVLDSGFSETRTITRNMVDGQCYVICHFYVGDGFTTEVEADGITIIDSGDELQVIVNEHYEVEYGGTISIVPKLFSVTQQKYISATTWTVKVYNNFTEEVIPTSDYTFTKNATGNDWTFTMSETKMIYGTPAQEYSPVLLFTAEI